MPPVFTPFSSLHFIIRAWKDKEYMCIHVTHVYTCRFLRVNLHPHLLIFLLSVVNEKGKWWELCLLTLHSCVECVCSAILAEGNKSLMLHVLQTEGVRNSGLEPPCWTKYVMTPFFCFRPCLSKTNIFFSLTSLCMDGICYIVTLRPHSLIAD